MLSGKGGTGKTSVSAALAALADSLIICDADVDAPDLHLVSGPVNRESHVFESSSLAEIDATRCTQCGICVDSCHFDAIASIPDDVPVINPFKCEGCRLCERLCPAEAIRSKKKTNNHWYVADSRFGTMIHARMGAGEENSGKLVTRVRNKARELAEAGNIPLILTDGPPGTGCPVIAAITGTDRILLVTEPSRSSLHDADRVVELARSFNIPLAAVINKADLHPSMRDEIRSYFHTMGIPVLGEIPFSEKFIHAMTMGLSISELDGAEQSREIFKKIAISLFYN